MTPSRDRPGLVAPDWPAPARVQAWSTTRTGGASAAPWGTLNLSFGVGDDPRAVERNRRRLREALGAPAEPCWLHQVHGTRVVEAGPDAAGTRADGSFASAPGRVCVVGTADCLPVLLCDAAGTRVAALHAGWRGLAAGVIEAGVAAMGAPPGSLLAWLGPAIGPRAYEVGEEVRAAFLDADAGSAAAFSPSPAGRWLADLYALARRRLAGAGVTRCHGGAHCTHGEPRRFFSYRRDGVTGRMATLIWLRD